MRCLSAILLVLAGACLGLPAAADQNDPRLEGLFNELLEAPDPRAAHGVEQQIWSLWTEHEEPSVNDLMSAGRTQMSQGDFTGALGSFEQIIEADPDFAEGWNKRATVHWLIAAYGESLADAERTLSLEESLADIERTLSLEPRHFGALSGRGLVYLGLEEWERALEAFEAALAVYPQMRGPQANAEALRQRLERDSI